MSQLKVNLDGTEAIVERKKYVRLKTKDLIEFGYTTLTEQSVDEQITIVLENKKTTKVQRTLSVIGHFIEDEIVEEIK